MRSRYKQVALACKKTIGAGLTILNVVVRLMYEVLQSCRERERERERVCTEGCPGTSGCPGADCGTDAEVATAAAHPASGGAGEVHMRAARAARAPGPAAGVANRVELRPVRTVKHGQAAGGLRARVRRRVCIHRLP